MPAMLRVSSEGATAHSMETIGVESYVANPRTMDEREILSAVDRAWAEKENIGQQLRRKVPEVKARAMNLFKEVLATLGLDA
jgi:hypothetical protein